MVDSVSSSTKNSISSAYKSQRDAMERAEEAQKRTREIEKQEEERVELLKDRYAQIRETESVRQEDSILKQRAKSYETLLQMKHEQEKDLASLKREGERNRIATKDLIDQELEIQKDRGEKEFLNTVSTQQQLLAFEKERGEREILSTKDQNLREFQSLQSVRDQRAHDLTRSAKQQYDHLRENYVQANDRAEEQFYDQHQRAIDTKNEILRKLNAQTVREIHKIKNDSVEKLVAYDNRQRDPFYQIMDMDADLSEYGDHYILTARVPSHERDGLRVLVKGDQLILSGSRRNEESFEYGPGEKKTTSNFQTFSQTFPIHPAVDQKGIQKAFNGDTLTVIIPKVTGPFHQRTPASKPPPEKARLERPTFPNNLPEQPTRTDEPPSLGDTLEHQVEAELRRPKTKGSGTLA